MTPISYGILIKHEDLLFFYLLFKFYFKMNINILHNDFLKSILKILPSLNSIYKV